MDLEMLFFSVLLSKTFCKSIWEGHKTKTITSTITAQIKQSRMGWLLIWWYGDSWQQKGGCLLCFVILLHTWFIFLHVFHQAVEAGQAERSICSTAVCTAWLWHLHRQPWVLQRGRLLSVGCSQPSGDSLHLESFSVSGDTKVGIQGGANPGGRRGLNVVFRDESRKPR